ncbi:MAG: hypothetical protein QOG90_459 [Actinomycetota bacterium]|jgi:hypothetical protein
MATENPKDALSPEDLEAQDGSSIPDKEAMSILEPDLNLLNLNVNVDLTAGVAAPVDAAVAANANVAAPIDAGVAANIASPDGTAVAQADQSSLIVQHLDGVADAVANQDSGITQ